MGKPIQATLAKLKEARGELVTFADDIWLNIDHQNSDQLEQGVAFIKLYNERLTELSRLTADLSALIEQYVKPSAGDDIHVLEDKRVTATRKASGFGSAKPHYVTEAEAMTHEKPEGFVLAGQRYTGISYWRDLLEMVSKYLAEYNPRRFEALAEHPTFKIRYSHTLGSSPKQWRPVTDSMYVYVNLSAKDTCIWISRLLEEFGIGERELEIYLKEKQSTASDEVA